jgi:hypothetical protein
MGAAKYNDYLMDPRYAHAKKAKYISFGTRIQRFASQDETTRLAEPGHERE